ncbi:MAG: DUF1906 domain-containing protein, partial [Anaerolineales bacterium]|nr:DUF1906 domain-containing protein [Anaerolineales bacterium]MDW8447291.1 DUF1906 domain-containing protein [Anaerolineales bacterium]
MTVWSDKISSLSAFLSIVLRVAIALMSGSCRLSYTFWSVLGLFSVASLFLVSNSNSRLPRVQNSSSARLFLRDFEPLSEREGWVWLGENVYFTSDRGRSWSIVPLPLREGRRLAAVDFGSSINGWALLAEGTEEHANSLLLARTSNGGRDWVFIPIPLAAEDRFLPIDRYYLTVWDGGTLWVVQKLVSSANFSIGILYRTFDGGDTWQRLQLPIAEPIQAESARDLWLRGGPRGNEIYRSSDGGVTWVQILSDPLQAQLLSEEARELRMVSALVGWKLEREGWCELESEMSSSRTDSRQSLRCRQEERLWSTRDGGHTWAPIPLPNGQASLSTEETIQTGVFIPLSSRALGEQEPDAPLIAWMQGHGFDKCEVPSLEQLSVWRTQSPYRAVNLYIGGANRYCSNAALSPEFIARLREQGWGLIPTWVGLQARCTGHKHRMSKYPPKAYLEGRSEAENATLVAQQLGLTTPAGNGSVIYYDLEYYDIRNEECNQAARAFISGWVERMNELGMIGGVYGSGRALSQFADLPNPPPVIWAAHWVYPAYTPEATVWDVLGLPNDLWKDRQRLRQYAGG